MAIDNKDIVKKIKEARLKRNMTQQDLASVLGKTASAISDMERGKVQVSASDLSTIADLLHTPIEFFYGEEIGDQYVSDIVTLVRREEPERRANTLEALKMLIAMSKFGVQLESNPEKELTPEELGEFITNFLTLSSQIKQLSSQLDEMKDKLVQELSAKGLNIPGLTP